MTTVLDASEEKKPRGASGEQMNLGGRVGDLCPAGIRPSAHRSQQQISESKRKHISLRDRNPRHDLLEKVTAHITSDR